jgi:hypothetical protein
MQKYQTEDLIPIKISKKTDEEKQKYILNIIDARKWDEFLKPKTTNIIFELYDNKNENKEQDSFSNKIGIVIRNIRINFLRFMAIWTIAIVSPLVALIIDAYYTYFDNKFFIRNHPYSYAISGIFLLSGNPLLGGLLMVISDYLIKPLLEYLEENNFFSKFIIKNSDQLKYLAILLSVTKITYLGFLIPVLIHYFNKKKNLTLMTFIIIFLNMLSGFALFHLIALWSISNIANKILNVNNEQSNKLVINVVEDYLNNPINKNGDVDVEVIKITDSKKNNYIEDNKPKQQSRVCDLVTNLFYFK